MQGREQGGIKAHQHPPAGPGELVERVDQHIRSLPMHGVGQDDACHRLPVGACPDKGVIGHHFQGDAFFLGGIPPGLGDRVLGHRLIGDQQHQTRRCVLQTVALARQQLMPLLTDFLRLHPQVRIELDMADRLRALATEGFDLAIRHTERAPDTHVAWTLCDTASVLVATKAYLRRAGTPAVPAELQQHNCLHYPRSQDIPVWSFTPTKATKGRETVNVPVRGSLSANNSEALREAALAGAGIALLPDFSAQAALRKGQLVQVLADWRVDGGFGRHIFAIRPYTAHVPRAVSALVAHLREGLANGFAA